MDQALESALHVFCEKGYDGASVAEERRSLRSCALSARRPHSSTPTSARRMTSA
jgi:hypothetical protein